MVLRRRRDFPGIVCIHRVVGTSLPRGVGDVAVPRHSSSPLDSHIQSVEEGAEDPFDSDTRPVRNVVDADDIH